MMLHNLGTHHCDNPLGITYITYIICFIRYAIHVSITLFITKLHQAAILYKNMM